MQLASTMTASQQTGEQRFTLAQCPAGHFPLHVCIVSDHALVMFVGFPVNIAFMVLRDQYLPVLAWLGVTTNHPFAAIFDAHFGASAAEGVSAWTCAASHIALIL